MPRRVGVYLEVVGVELTTACRLQQRCAERHHLLVGCVDVFDPQVEVDVLRRPERPSGDDVVSRGLMPRSPRPPSPVRKTATVGAAAITCLWYGPPVSGPAALEIRRQQGVRPR